MLTYWKAIQNGCGLCVGLLLIVPPIAVFWLGGLLFNVVAWSAICLSLCNRPRGMCCAFPCFAVAFGVLTLSIGMNSPLPWYWEIERSQVLRHVSVCDSKQWKDSTGPIYFRDGALTQHGQMPKAVPINITHCWEKTLKPLKIGSRKQWLNCYFMVQPVFQCDYSGLPSPLMSDACTEPQACAWAVTSAASLGFVNFPEAPKVPDCGKPGLCGFATHLLFHYPEVKQDSSIDAFHAELQAAARQYSVDLTAESPLLHLVNPAEEAAALGAVAPIFYLLLLLYMPFGAICAFLLLLCKGGRGILLQKCRELRYLQADSDSDGSSRDSD